MFKTLSNDFADVIVLLDQGETEAIEHFQTIGSSSKKVGVNINYDINFYNAETWTIRKVMMKEILFARNSAKKSEKK